MTNLQLFTYGAREVRMVLIGGDPHFSASDVCAILDVGNPSQAMTRLDDDERALISNEGREMNVVTESGLYSLVLGSRKAEAKAFKRWITHEVLPAIRKTGSYAATEAPILTGPELMARALLEAQQVIEAADAKVLELTPKAAAFDAFLSSTGDYSINEAAKVLSRSDGISIGEHRLRDKLMGWGWMYRSGQGKPRAKQSMVDTGRLVEKAQWHYHPVTAEKVLDAPQVRITAKGFEAVHKRLMNEASGLAVTA